MLGKTKINVDIIGQWADHRQQFTADIYEYFGYGIKRFRSEMHNGHVTFVRIESTEPVYEMPESNDIVVASIHSLGGKKYERIEEEDFARVLNATDLEDFEFSEDDDDEKEAEERAYHAQTKRKGHSPYPGFYPWFLVAVLIFAAFLLAVIYVTVRTCTNREDRQKYRFTGLKILKS